MTREEVAGVLSLLNGNSQLMTELHYGSGLRIMEADIKKQFAQMS
jgi:hypothetical protein